MRKNIIKSVLGVGLSILLTACSGEYAPMNAKMEAQVEASDGTFNGVANGLVGQSTYGTSSTTDFNQEMEAFANRKLVRTGDVKFETEDIQQTELEIKKAVRRLGGFISFEQQTRNDWSVRTDLEIRMPGTLFELMLDSVCSGALKIDEKNIKVQDVTEQYVDTEARIATRKMVEQKYIEHLAKAKEIDEVLRIESKIGAIRAEIESAERRLRKLQDQVSLSTLHVEFYQTIERPKIEPVNKFEKAVKFGWEGLENFLVILTTIWPIILLGGIVFFVLRKYLGNKE